MMRWNTYLSKENTTQDLNIIEENLLHVTGYTCVLVILLMVFIDIQNYIVSY